MFAVIGRGLFYEVAPTRFGTLGKAFFTLFQLITLDDWFFMYSDVVAKSPGKRLIFAKITGKSIIRCYFNSGKKQRGKKSSFKEIAPEMHVFEADFETHISGFSFCKCLALSRAPARFLEVNFF